MNVSPNKTVFEHKQQFGIRLSSIVRFACACVVLMLVVMALLIAVMHYFTDALEKENKEVILPRLDADKERLLTLIKLMRLGEEVFSAQDLESLRGCQQKVRVLSHGVRSEDETDSWITFQDILNRINTIAENRVEQQIQNKRIYELLGQVDALWAKMFSVRSIAGNVSPKNKDELSTIIEELLLLRVYLSSATAVTDSGELFKLREKGRYITFLLARQTTNFKSTWLTSPLRQSLEGIESFQQAFDMRRDILELDMQNAGLWSQARNELELLMKYFTARTRAALSLRFGAIHAHAELAFLMLGIGCVGLSILLMLVMMFFRRDIAKPIIQAAQMLKDAGKEGEHVEIEPDPTSRVLELKSLLHFSKQNRHAHQESTRTQELEQEIRERAYVEEALRKSNEQLQGILDHSPTHIYLKDANSKYLFVNTTYCKQLGVKEHEVIGKASHEIFPESEADIFKEHDAEVFAKLAPVTREEVLHFNGRTFTFLTTKFPLLDSKGKAWALCGIANDVTEKNKLQAEALRASQLAALGELAAGVAHEINNPVNGILNYAQLLAEEGLAEQKKEEVRNKIIREGERIAAIVRTLLNYAGGRGAQEPKSGVPLANILEGALSLTQNQLRHDNIILELPDFAELPEVVVRSREIQQVFINLLTNARYALNAKFPGHSAEKVISIIVENGGDCVKIEVQDRGTGIPENIMPKVFDPFFSTKPKTEGTGLGLAVCRKIVEEHEGQLYFESEQGRFTHAILQLPAARSS